MLVSTTIFAQAPYLSIPSGGLESSRNLGKLIAMKAVIVGTAGHIDHGKSALVRALTGTDPDRLEEEKRRGITIDIGFANLDLTEPVGRADPHRLRRCARPRTLRAQHAGRRRRHRSGAAGCCGRRRRSSRRLANTSTSAACWPYSVGSPFLPSQTWSIADTLEVVTHGSGGISERLVSGSGEFAHRRRQLENRRRPRPAQAASWRGWRPKFLRRIPPPSSACPSIACSP